MSSLSYVYNHPLRDQMWHLVHDRCDQTWNYRLDLCDQAWHFHSYIWFISHMLFNQLWSISTCHTFICAMVCLILHKYLDSTSFTSAIMKCEILFLIYVFMCWTFKLLYDLYDSMWIFMLYATKYEIFQHWTYHKLVHECVLFVQKTWLVSCLIWIQSETNAWFVWSMQNLYTFWFMW